MYAVLGARRAPSFLRPVLFINGIIVIVLGLTMLIPAAMDGLAGSPEPWLFLDCAGISIFIGCAFVLTNMSASFELTKRQIYMITASIWVVVPLFGAMPFEISHLHMSFTDAFFEAMSGVTTTGSTVMTGLDHLPASLQLWRGILQWLGGLGIMVVSFSIMPILHVGGMQIFQSEAFDLGEKAFPRMAATSVWLTLVYMILTTLCFGALYAAGMTGTEAASHAMTTIATGGFSTSDQSVGHFDSALIDAIITAGMVFGGLPFMLLLMSARGRPGKLLQDDQVRWYFGLLLFSTFIVGGWLVMHGGLGFGAALRYASFTVASIMTGTGFATTDYQLWGWVPVILLFFLTFVGGCTGSTSCGIKVFRFRIIAAIVNVELKKIIHPHGVFTAYYNDRPINQEVATSVLNFLTAFIFVFAALTVALGIVGLDFTTAFSSAATAVANVGPGLGKIVGPSGTFHDLPDSAKWLLAGGMLIGRLEVMTVLVLFSARFWRS
jgi:trk system potassium uptake protein TrkH